MRIVRYFFVGGVAASVDIGLFAVFAKGLGFNYLVVGVFTFVAATAVNYALSVRHVFDSGARFARHHEIALVFAMSAVGLLINQAALFIGVGIAGLELVLTKVLATGVVFFWNYWARAHFVFKPVARL